MDQDRLLPAIGLRLASVALFAAMNALIKLAEARGAAIGEILFFRQGGAAVLVASVVAAGPGMRTLETKRLPAHILRAVVGLTAMTFTFSAVLALPLAEATTVNFTVPIFATILGAAVLREPTGVQRWSAVAAGFAGVLIVTQPGGGHLPLVGALCGLTGAFGTASVSILLRRMGRTEAPLTTVFWFSTLSLAPLAPYYLTVARGHAAVVWLLLVGIGLFGGAAQVAMTNSLRLAPVSVVVPMDYTALIWATAYGWLLFGALPVAATWLGAPIIVASGLFIVWREHVRRREETRQAVAQGFS